MPELPSRPNLDQLRHQARELLRSARSGDAEGLRRMAAVSDHVALASAQLALAREYGFSSWRQLVAEVEERRAAEPTDGPAAVSSGRRMPSWSAGPAVRLTDGFLQPRGVIPEPEGYVLRATVTGTAGTEAVNRRLFRRRPPRRPVLGVEGLTIADSRGHAYVHSRSRGMGSVSSSSPGVEQAHLDLRLDPAPDPEAEWIELQGPDGASTRLLRGVPTAIEVEQLMPVDADAGRRHVEMLARRLLAMRLAGAPIGGPFFVERCQQATAQLDALDTRGIAIPPAARDDLTALCHHLTATADAATVPLGWRSVLENADKVGGMRRNADVAVELPPIDGITVTVDTVGFEDTSWCLYLRATPSWWSIDHQELALGASDDTGATYVAIHDGSLSFRANGGGHVVRQRFRPRLDPTASTVRMTLRGSHEAVALRIPLPAPHG